MKQIPFFLGLWTLFATGLFGAEQHFKLTPQTLVGWKANGADLSLLAAQSELTLPACAQLSRTFAPGSVTIHLVSQPFFGSDLTDWPSLEVGPASLAFTQENGFGKLVLMVGDRAPVVLPVSVALDGGDQSAQPVDLTLSFDSSHGLVTATIDGRTFPSVIGPANVSAIDVAMAGGSKTKWSFASVDVMVATPDVAGEVGNSLSSNGAHNHGTDASGSGTTRPTTGGATIAGNPIARPAKPTKPAPVVAPQRLEVFTPPSVREPKIEHTSVPPTTTAIAK